ncbi:sensor histidine kinase [Sphaerisporangium fuscum]|uniref:sensor histidine kinase n=1 Tax=Sphaerisporangium fuscum TaxID=2835868 RepID=UPI001BDBB852|nr:histidine kinase [Sphaerisporangium fuscum]
MPVNPLDERERPDARILTALRSALSVKAGWQQAVDLGLVALLVALFAAGGTSVSPVLAAGQIVPLAWRRRAPAAVLAVVGLCTVAHMLSGMSRTVGYTPAVLAIYSAAMSGAKAVRWGLCGVTVAAVSAASVPGRGTVESLVAAVVVFTLAWLAGVERGRHLRERTAMAAEAARLRLERRIAGEAAKAAEGRELLARRLHDTLAHTLTVMLVQVEAVRSTARLGPADGERLDRVLGAGRDALTEVRRAIADLDAAGSAASADELARRLGELRAAGLHMRADLAGTLARDLAVLPGPVLQVANRLVGEAATNALRHNGPGTKLRVQVEEGPGVLTVRVAGGLRSGPAGEPGYGLRSLARDVRACGGELLHGAEEDGEWVVTATFPRILEIVAADAEGGGPAQAAGGFSSL